MSREPTEPDTPGEEAGYVLTVGDVAARLGVSASTVRRWSDGDQPLLPVRRLPSLIPGRRGQRRYREVDVFAFAERIERGEVEL
jgi:DNA-binding transcriptional MerR regulator